MALAEQAVEIEPQVAVVAGLVDEVPGRGGHGLEQVALDLRAADQLSSRPMSKVPA